MPRRWASTPRVWASTAAPPEVPLPPWSQLNPAITCYIGFNGSYDFVEGGYGAGSTGFGQHLPSYEANSAIDNIRDNPPATLLLHGSDDTIIPVGESLKYEAALQEAGGEAETRVYRGFGHAFYNLGGNRPMHRPTLHASAKHLSQVFNLGIYDGTTPPPAPTGLTATAGDALVSLSWEKVAGEDPVTYNLYRSTTAGLHGSPLVTSLTTNSHDDASVANGTIYHYVVTAVDRDGRESTASAEKFAIPAAPGNAAPSFSANPIVKPSVVEGDSYSASLAGDASDPESDPTIFSKVDGPEWLEVAGDGGLSGTAPATPGLNSFTVRVDAAGGSNTATLEITVDPDTTPPPPPTGLVATPGEGLVALNWNDHGDPVSYRVYRSTTSGNHEEALVTNLDKSRYLDTMVTNDVTYFYVVTAVDAGNNESSPSDEVSAVPMMTKAVTVADFSFDGPSTVSFDNDPHSGTGALAEGGGLGADYETRDTRGDPKPAFTWTVGDYNDGTILDNDYLTFTVTPAAGITLTLDQLSLRFSGVETDIHLFSSQAGFATLDDAIASLAHLREEDAPLTADLSGLPPVNGPIEFRLYFDTAATFSQAEVWIDNIRLSATRVTAAPDTDGDGIDDSWETSYFPSTETTDGSLDSDGDGVLDFFEYLYGSAPNDASSRGFRVEAATNAIGRTVFEWMVRTGFILQEDYLVHVSSNLIFWEPLPPEDYALGSTVTGEHTRHTLELTGQHGGQVFLRLAAP